MTVFEALIDDVGGLGRFQLLLMFAIESCQFTAGWSMLQMSFARLTPKFECLVDNANLSDSHESDEIFDVCDVNGTKCSSFNFLSSSKITATTEWLLLCDQKWIQGIIISAQMAGVLVGALLTGQLSDAIGRKKVLYSLVLFHIISNFIAATSISWQMFCAMRFFIGMGIGGIILLCLPYPMEFLPVKWRPILSIIPTWAVGVSIFAGSAVFLGNWSHLHIACGAVSIPSLLGIFFVPESMRWLTMHGRLKEAEEVLAKIARWNNRELPENTMQMLQQVEKMELDSKRAKRVYSFIDLVKTWKTTKISLCLWISWFVLSITYYGISFGVDSLHGNIFLNICLLGVLEIPVQSTTFFTNNRFGRRPSTVFFFSISALTTGACLVCFELTSGSTLGISINVLSMIVKTLIGSAWSCLQVWGSELYPTVVRNLGFSFSSAGARVGGILAPFIIHLDSQMKLSYGILTGLLFAGAAVCFILPETRGKALKDSQYAKEDDIVLVYDNQKKKQVTKDDSVDNELSTFPISERSA